MDWYVGDVKSAINEVKSKNKKLLVFLKGLKLEKSSIEADQFSNAFKPASVPCLFLIAASGQVVDTKYGSIEKEALIGWLVEHSSKSVPSDSCQSISQVPSDDPVASSSRDAAAQLQDVRERMASKYHESGPATELKHEADEEMKRREAGKSLHEFKEKQRAREIDQMMAERKKDEEESKLRLQQLRRMIAEDRRERKERGAAPKIDKSPVDEVCDETAAPSQVKLASHEARLQFRIIPSSTGSSSAATPSAGGFLSTIGQFSQSATLETDVRPWLQSLLGINNNGTTCLSSSVDVHFCDQLATLSSRGFQFRRLYPPKLLLHEDEVLPLSELDLCPSAVLVLTPSGDRQLIQSSINWSLLGLVTLARDLAFGFVNSLWTNVASIWNYVTTPSRGSSGEAPAASDSQSKTAPSDRQEEAQTTSSSYGGGKSRGVRRVGNMGRLSHLPDDSDDEQARWNGNSTEQL